jgi:hypothetical protein
MGPVGPEQNLKELPQVFENKGVSSGPARTTAQEEVQNQVHVAPIPAPLPPDLAAVVKAWPRLPDHIKQAILTLVQTAQGGKSGQP